MNDFTFIANNYIPPLPMAAAMSPAMVIAHRPQQMPISPASTQSALSPPEHSSPPPPPSEPAIVRSHDLEPVKPTPNQMQSVFSSQTGEAYRSQQHSAQVWETHKEEIRQLYLDENRPLKEVMAIMRQRGFRATVRMYKSRFDKWGFSKNNSKKEVITMLQVQRQRNALGKRTTFQRNGREVAIDAYLKRKGISQYDLAEPGIAEKLPEHLRCVTPPPETPILIPTGGALSLQELVLQCARDLAWNPYCPPDFPLVTSAAVYRGDELRCAITDLTNADWLFHVGHYERGGAMCEQGFKSLHLMVQRPSIYGLLHLLIFHLDAYNRGIVKEVWRYLAAYSATIKADGPLARLFQGVFKFLNTHEYEEYWDLIFECTEKLLLVDEQSTGLPEDTVARLYPLIFIPRAHQYRSDPYRRLQSRCDFSRLTRGSKPRGPEEATVYQASELLITGQQSRWRGPEVLRLAEQVLENTKNFAYNVDFFVYIALTAMAHYYRAEFQPPAPAPASSLSSSSPSSSVTSATATATTTTSTASPCDDIEEVAAPDPEDDPSASPAHLMSTHYLERAVRLMEGKWDPDMGYLLGDLELLEKWYREAGDTELADAAHARWQSALEIIPKNWERGRKGILI
ncbi:hypothetical protein F4809DRAFT_428977 [Biscogniauxia mediterranea]|nr:hypothetical protein F4809DRAFT_428977 [Biscogniauxia mediterranea]